MRKKNINKLKLKWKLIVVLSTLFVVMISLGYGSEVIETHLRDTSKDIASPKDIIQPNDIAPPKDIIQPNDIAPPKDIAPLIELMPLENMSQTKNADQSANTIEDLSQKDKAAIRRQILDSKPLLNYPYDLQEAQKKAAEAALSSGK
jgi:hypothetical protein